MTGKQLLGVISIALIIGLSYATGDYLDNCSALAALDVNAKSDEMCNEKKGLDCKDGKCQCHHTTNVYEKGTGRCLGAANVNSSCSEKDAPCVANSVCSSTGICSCKEGYHSKDGHCNSANSKTIITTTPFYLIILLLFCTVLGK